MACILCGVIHQDVVTFGLTHFCQIIPCELSQSRVAYKLGYAQTIGYMFLRWYRKVARHLFGGFPSIPTWIPAPTGASWCWCPLLTVQDLQVFLPANAGILACGQLTHHCEVLIGYHMTKVLS